jgi:membrane protease YdiL (CAAX protease family)
MKEGQWPKLLIGLAAIFVLFQWIASALGSDRGQVGILIGLIVVIATIAAERLLFGKSFAAAILALGLGVPALRGLLTAVVISVILLLSIPVFASVMDASFSVYPGWLSLIPGLFFQGGIGEETLFRGYLFGHLRQRYSFWKAAM